MKEASSSALSNLEMSCSSTRISMAVSLPIPGAVRRSLILSRYFAAEEGDLLLIRTICRVRYS